jgi:hypothetical protein
MPPAYVVIFTIAAIAVVILGFVYIKRKRIRK